jgi:hypothetical protein
MEVCRAERSSAMYGEEQGIIQNDREEEAAVEANEGCDQM